MDKLSKFICSEKLDLTIFNIKLLKTSLKLQQTFLKFCYLKLNTPLVS